MRFDHLRSIRPEKMPLLPPSLFPNFLPVFAGLRKTMELVTNPGNPGKPWRGFTSRVGEEKRDVFIAVDQKGKVGTKKGLIHEICPGQGSASSQPCASEHVWRLLW